MRLSRRARGINLQVASGHVFVTDRQRYILIKNISADLNGSVASRVGSAIEIYVVDSATVEYAMQI